MVKSEKVEVGKIYTYKELCRIFEEPEKTSDSRTAQKKEWSRFFRWSNPTARKYQIEEIYEIPKEKQDRRRFNGGNCTSKYLALDDSIMFYLNEKQHINGTISVLLIMIGLLRPEYIENRREHKDYKGSEWSEGVVNHVFWRMNDIVINAGKNSLERLRKDHYISVSTQITVAVKGNKKISLSAEKSQRVEEILAKVREELNLKPNELFQPDRREEYENRVKQYIEEEVKQPVLYFYRVYDISCTGKEYPYKTVEMVDMLTRRFVKAICTSILKIDFGHGYYRRDDIAIQTMKLLNRQFMHLSEESWGKWFSELLETEMNEEESVFFNVYYYPYMNWAGQERKKLQKQAQQENKITEERMRENEELEQVFKDIERKEYQRDVEAARREAVASLGEEQVQEAEQIIPNLDWKKIMESENQQDPYLKYAQYLMESYFGAVDMTIYVKNKKERIKMIENKMNGAMKDYKMFHGQDGYEWLADLDTPWSMNGLEI